MAFQKAYNRTVDAPTVVVPSTNDEMVQAINQLDILKLCAPWIKLYGQFRGNSVDSGIGAKKFVTKFQELLRNTFKTINGADPDAILKEHRQSDNDIPAFSKEVNETIFDILSDICEGEAYDIIAPYTISDDDNAIPRDGRRAFFALMREYFPVSANCCKTAEAELRDFRFTTVKDQSTAYRTKFRKLVSDLGEARGLALTRLEKWNALTDSISGPEFAPLRVILNFQREAKENDIDWLLNAITEFIADPGFASIPNDKGVAFGITDTQSISKDSTASSLADILENIKSTLGAITSSALTAPRGPNKVKRNKAKLNKSDGPPRDCKFCPGERHWHRDCPKLLALEQSATNTASVQAEKVKLAAITNQHRTPGKGFLLGAKATDEHRPQGHSSTCTPSPSKTRPGGLLRRLATTTICHPLLWLLTTLTGQTWLNVTIFTCMVVTVLTSSVGTLSSTLAALTSSSRENHFELETPMFMIDSGASDHICGHLELFRDFRDTSTKQFDVVHGDTVCSAGTGTIELIAKDTVDGEWSTLTLQDVHYIPNQPMSLISVSKAISNSGVSNPDFVNRTWTIGDKSFELIDTNGTFTLKAYPARSPL